MSLSRTPGIHPIQNTSAVLIADNSVFDKGRVVLETDTNRVKTGDGVSTYTQLTYVEWNYEIVEAVGTNTYTGNFSKPFFLAYFSLMRIRVRFTNANTGASTINLNGLGAIAIRKNVSTALVAGDILAGGIYELSYDGTNFQLLTVTGNSAGVVPAALTRVDDTNVTLTLGGTPATSLLQAVSLTLGWTGQLPLARGGTNANLTASNGGIFYSTATAGAILAGTATAGQILRSGASAAPSWSTATYPATAASTGTILRADGTNWAASTNTYPNTTAVNHVLYATGANVIGSSANFVYNGSQLDVRRDGAGIQTAYSLSNNTAAAAGVGCGIDFQNNTGNRMGFLSMAWSGAANTDAYFDITTRRANVLTHAVRVLNTGNLVIGSTALVSTERLSLQNNVNALTFFLISNTTSGTAGQAAIATWTTGSVGITLRAISAGYTTSGIKVANTSALQCDQTGGLNIGTSSNAQVSIWTNDTKKVAIPAAGGLVIGTAALATTATDGFLYIPTCAGTPTGVPTAQTGTVAMVFDTTNNILYIYDGGWLGGTNPGAFT